MCIYKFLREGVYYLPFLEFNKSFQLTKEQDNSSPAITIPTGLPFDNSVQTQAFVSEIILPIRDSR